MLKWNGEPYTFETFCDLADRLAEHCEPDSLRFLYNIRVGIVDHFLGLDWLRKYGSLDSSEQSYLKPRVQDADWTDFSMRLLNLVEMLYNLQAVIGVRNPLEDIANGQIEPGLAELQVGMLLVQNGWRFHYVDRVAGHRTCDLEIEGDQGAWPAEVKCKIDGTDLSDKAIISALRKARDQLPPDDAGGGIVFMRCPRTWAVDGTGRVRMPPETITAVNDYMHRTRRIGLVVPYVFQYELRPDNFLVTIGVREVPSHRHPGLRWWDEPLLPMDGRGNWVSLPALVGRWAGLRG